MNLSRVEIINKGEFEPREWLRREVLWASLMTPYSTQAKTWHNGSAIAQHHGNVNRQSIYEKEHDAEAQALAFFNHGKNIGGIVSSAVLFRISLDKTGEGAHINILDEQASIVDRILGRRPTDFIDDELDDEAVYAQCAELSDVIYKENQTPHLRNELLLRASNIMSALACREAGVWIESSLQNTNHSLPILTIHDGGHPRSAGQRVERLQPIFQKIVSSEKFQALRSA